MMKVVRVGLKIIVSTILLVVLFKLIDVKAVMESWQTLSWKAFVPPFIVFGCGLCIQAWRYQIALNSGGIRLPWRQTMKVQLMGLFMNQFLPGMFGGDVLRAAYWMPQYKDKKRFLSAAVIYERLNGLLGIVILAFFGSAYMASNQQDFRWLTLVSLVVVVAITAIALVYGLSKKGSKSIRWLHIGFDVLELVRVLFSKRHLTRIIMLLSILSQCMTVLVVWLLLAAIGVSLAFPITIVAVALSWLVGLIPISLNGLGLRESSMTTVFWMVGVSQTQALSVALLAIGPMISWALLGGLLMLLDPVKLKNLKNEITVT